MTSKELNEEPYEVKPHVRFCRVAVRVTYLSTFPLLNGLAVIFLLHVHSQNDDVFPKSNFVVQHLGLAIL